MKALGTQIAGNHYKDLPYQPVELWAKLKLNAFEGAMVKYITRYKDKNGSEDLNKVLHFWKLYQELKPLPRWYRFVPWYIEHVWYYKMSKEVDRYCDMNNMEPTQKKALKIALSRITERHDMALWIGFLKTMRRGTE
jgi:hypothetical protein